MAGARTYPRREELRTAAVTIYITGRPQDCHPAGEVQHGHRRRQSPGTQPGPGPSDEAELRGSPGGDHFCPVAH